MTVFGSAVEVVEQYVAEIRPCFGAPRHPAMFLTERGTRIALAYINVALVGAPNLTAMNARSRSETRLSPRLQVFVPPNVGPSPDVSAKFSHRGRFRSSATHYRSRLRASAPTVARSRPQWTAMKEGLLGGTLSVSSRSELEEARLYVARWIGPESKENRRVPAVAGRRDRRGVGIAA